MKFLHFACLSLAILFVLGPTCSSQALDEEDSSNLHLTLSFMGSTAVEERGEQSLTGTIELLPVSGGWEPRELQLEDRVTGAEPFVFELHLPAGSSWSVKAEIEDYWSPTEVANVPEDVATVTQALRLWPLATLKGQVDPNSDVDGLVARFEPTARGSDEPKRETFGRSSIECPLDPSGGWSCRLPATRLDLSLVAKGMVPHYFWDLDLSKKGGITLGTLDFVPGASLVGRVETEEGLPPEGPTEVRLVPRVAGAGSGLGRTGKRIERAEVVAEVGRRGFFQLTGISPGSYVVEATHPKFAPARIHPIEIFERAETRLNGPLVLRPPIDLTIEISPQLDWLTERWNVQILQRSEFSSGFDERPIFDSRAGEDGKVHLENLRPGVFSVAVADSLGNRHYLDDHLEVEGSGSFTEHVELDLTLVRGTVEYGDERLPATVYFGGRYGPTRIRMEANSDGRFQGLLPRTGNWRVEVVATDPPLESELQVMVSEDSPVELKILATEVTGVVVRPDGQPVPGARVTLSGGSKSDLSKADREGRFEFRGFEPGAVVLASKASIEGVQHFSDQLVEVVQEEQPAGPVQLVLRHAVRPFKGRVVSDQGPVAGAKVFVQPVQPPLAQSGIGGTNLDGRFEVDVAADAQLVQVTVLPPGYAFTTTLLDRSAEEPTIQVSPVGGELVVVDERPKAAESSSGTGRQGRMVLLSEGFAIPWQLVVEWVRGNGAVLNPAQSSLLVPNLQPGEYSICTMPAQQLSEQRMTGGSGQDAVQDCTRGYVGAGERLELVLKSK